VIKIKGRGGKRHIGGVVVRGSLKGLKTQTLSGRLVKQLGASKAQIMPALHGVVVIPAAVVGLDVNPIHRL
jgi:hypothetical protein